jgi:hypothetical protein
MAYMTGIERLAIERGRQEGRREGEVHGRATLLAIQLVERFGPLPETIQTRLAQATNNCWSAKASAGTSVCSTPRHSMQS